MAFEAVTGKAKEATTQRPRPVPATLYWMALVILTLYVVLLWGPLVLDAVRQVRDAVEEV